MRSPSHRRRSWLPVTSVIVSLFFGVGLYVVSPKSNGHRAVAKGQDREVAGEQPKVAADGGRAAVEAWLDENLDDPQWAEVRWWPARELTVRRDTAIRNASGRIDAAESRLAQLVAKKAAFEEQGVRPAAERQDPGSTGATSDTREFDAENEYDFVARLIRSAERDIAAARTEMLAARNTEALEVARLKFRSQGPLGSSLLDWTFRIEGGRAEPIATSDEEKSATFP